MVASIRPILSMPEHAAAARPHVWHALPGCVLLLSRFVQHRRGVRSPDQARTHRSWWTAFEWFFRTRDRRSRGAVLELAVRGATRLLILISTWPIRSNSVACAWQAQHSGTVSLLSWTRPAQWWFSKRVSRPHSKHRFRSARLDNRLAVFNGFSSIMMRTPARHKWHRVGGHRLLRARSGFPDR